MLSAIKKTSLGVDGVPYWSTSIVLLNLHPFSHILLIKLSTMVVLLQCGLKLLSLCIPKKTQPTDFSHLRPISVTSIMSRVTERLIVRKYLLPALPSDQILD